MLRRKFTLTKASTGELFGKKKAIPHISRYYNYNPKELVLFNNQIDAVLQGSLKVKMYKVVFNTSEMGAGKTASTIAMINNLPPETKLVVVICPNNAKSTWYKAFNQWQSKTLVAVISQDSLTSDIESLGGKILDQENFKVPVGNLPQDFLTSTPGLFTPSSDKEEKKRRVVNDIRYNATDLWKAICEAGAAVVIDEAHGMKNSTARNARVTELLKYVLPAPYSFLYVLSATLIDVPSSALNIASMIGMKDQNLGWVINVSKEPIFWDQGTGTQYGLGQMLDRTRQYFDRPTLACTVDKVIVETLSEKVTDQGGVRTQRRKYNPTPQGRGENQAGRLNFETSVTGEIEYYVPESANPRDPAKDTYIAYPQIARDTWMDLGLDIMTKSILYHSSVEIPNTRVERRAYRAFVKVAPEYEQDLKDAMSSFKDAASSILKSKKQGAGAGAAQTSSLFGAVNIAIHDIEVIMVYEYWRVAKKFLDEVLSVEYADWMRMPIHGPERNQTLDVPMNRIVIGVWYLKSLDILIDLTRRSGMGHQVLVISGSTPSDERAKNIDLWKEVNSKYRIFILTRAGGTSISLDDELGNRPTNLITTPTYNFNDVHQISGRTLRPNMMSPSNVMIIFPQLSTPGGEESIDNIMNSLARKSQVTKMTRKIHYIKFGDRMTKVTFPGDHPRWIEDYGFIDENKLEMEIKSGRYTRDDINMIDQDIIYAMQYFNQRDPDRRLPIHVPPPQYIIALEELSCNLEINPNNPLGLADDEIDADLTTSDNEGEMRIENRCIVQPLLYDENMELIKGTSEEDAHEVSYPSTFVLGDAPWRKGDLSLLAVMGYPIKDEKGKMVFSGTPGIKPMGTTNGADWFLQPAGACYGQFSQVNPECFGTNATFISGAPASSIFGGPAPVSSIFGGPAPVSSIFGGPAPASKPSPGFGVAPSPVAPPQAPASSRPSRYARPQYTPPQEPSSVSHKSQPRIAVQHPDPTQPPRYGRTATPGQVPPQPPRYAPPRYTPPK